MSELSEAIEKAAEGEHGEFFNKRIALIIAILALFLSFSETLAKGAQTETVTKNIRSLGPVGVLPGQGHSPDRGHRGRRSDRPVGGQPDRSGRQGGHRQAGRDLAHTPPSAMNRTRRPAMAASNWKRRPRMPRRSAICRPRNTITTNSPPPPFRSASCWRRRRSSPAWWRWRGSPAGSALSAPCCWRSGFTRRTPCR